MIVTLTHAECRAAAYVGMNRRLDAMRNRSVEVYGAAAGADYWTIDVEAAGAEIAVAKHLGVFFGARDSPEEDREGDVAPGVQVRHTRHENGSLIVHDRDADDHCFVLAIGAMPSFRLAGWLMGHSAKDPAFWRSNVPRPAFFAPQSRLRSMELIHAR